VAAVIAAPPEAVGECLPISPETLEKQEMGRHVLECHRKLAEMGGKNQEVFGPLVDRLAEELKDKG
jgi:hypothetical protein